MSEFRRRVVLFVAIVACASPAIAAPPADTGLERQKIEKLNQELDDAILHMDNARVLALWADDGVTLLPGLAPVEGKKNIADFMEKVVASMPGFHVSEQHTDYRDLQISGDWASQWGLTHQVAVPPDGKPAIDVRGKILLVLHRESDGTWKIEREMWNTDAKQ
jgi:uncharacterized protein (TIGR02246 family)